MKCIEYNSIIYNSIAKSDISSHKNLMLEHNDFLLSDNSRLYDLIIGNPPFYVMKKQDCPREYDDYYTGRPNIFIIFITFIQLTLYLNHLILNHQYLHQYLHHLT